MDRLSIKWRLGGGFGLIALIIFVMAATTIWMLNRLNVEFGALERSFSDYSRIAAIQEDLGEARMYAFAWRAAGGADRVSSVRDNIDEALQEIAAGRAEARSASVEADRLFRLVESYGLAFERLAAGDQTQAAILDSIGPEMLALIEARYDAINAEVDAYQASYSALSGRTLALVLILAAAGVLIALVVGVAIVSSLTRPLGHLVDRIMAMADGDYDSDMPHTRLRDELGGLATAQDSLRERLQAARELEAEAQRRNEQRNRRAEALDTLIGEFEAEAEHSVLLLSESGERLREASRSVSDITGSVNERASSIAASSQQSAANVQTVASSAEQLAASINEILRSAEDTAASVVAAAEQSGQARDELEAMVEAVDGMHAMLDSISGVAEQTNLLALNATIEAARAGEAGKGFAVVADEVKALASQTQSLTEKIGRQIEGLRTRSSAVAASAGAIGDALDGIRGQAAATTSTAQQQTAAVREISASAQEAATGAGDSSAGVEAISGSVAGAVTEANAVEEVADQVASSSRQLQSRISAFISAVKAA